jgi:hypothetical protein
MEDAASASHSCAPPVSDRQRMLHPRPHPPSDADLAPRLPKVIAMLTTILDKLTSGKPVLKIVFADSEVNASPEGMIIKFAEESEVANAWVCYDETGIWLTGNAHVTDPAGYHGVRGFAEPLSAIKDVVLTGD